MTQKSSIAWKKIQLSHRGGRGRGHPFPKQGSPGPVLCTRRVVKRKKKRIAKKRPKIRPTSCLQSQKSKRKRIT